MYKIIILFFIGFFTFSCFNKNSISDISLSSQNKKVEIPIKFKMSKSTFPEEWKTPEINPKAVSLDSKEVKRSITIIRKALKKYPPEVLSENLIKVYVLKSMNFFGVNYGGTNSNDVVYIANNGVSEGYTDEYIEKTFHHEFSSILLRNYPDYFNDKKWKSFNSSNYLDKSGSGGVKAIKSNTASTNFDEKLMKKGFLFEYAMSDMENDLNSFAENIFYPTPEFRDFISKYPKIKQKQNLIIDFYYKINPVFTIEYFDKFLIKDSL